MAYVPGSTDRLRNDVQGLEAGRVGSDQHIDGDEVGSSPTVDEPSFTDVRKPDVLLAELSGGEGVEGLRWRVVMPGGNVMNFSRIEPPKNGRVTLGLEQEQIDEAMLALRGEEPENWAKRDVSFEKPIYMGQTEVTNQEYLRFVQTTGRTWTEEIVTGRRGEPSVIHKVDIEVAEDRLRHPATQVSYDDAIAFCEWMTKQHAPEGYYFRLPREGEWEYVASQKGKREHFPFLLNQGESLETKVHGGPTQNRRKDTLSVDSVPNGLSADGVAHLIGNVWEMVDISPEDPYKRKLDEAGEVLSKGGSYRNIFTTEMWAQSRWRLPKNGTAKAFVGFRIVLAPR